MSEAYEELNDAYKEKQNEYDSAFEESEDIKKKLDAVKDEYLCKLILMSELQGEIDEMGRDLRCWDDEKEKKL